MGLRETVYTRCTTHAGIAALIGTRCYADRLPKDIVYPCLMHHTPVSANNETYRTHDGAGSRSEDRVQFDCYGSTGDDATELAAQVRVAWDGYSVSDGSIGYAFVANEIVNREDAINAYRVIMDVIIEHSIA
jgi:hypothetical protein